MVVVPASAMIALQSTLAGAADMRSADAAAATVTAAMSDKRCFMTASRSDDVATLGSACLPGTRDATKRSSVA